MLNLAIIKNIYSSCRDLNPAGLSCGWRVVSLACALGTAVIASGPTRAAATDAKRASRPRQTHQIFVPSLTLILPEFSSNKMEQQPSNKPQDRKPQGRLERVSKTTSKKLESVTNRSYVLRSAEKIWNITDPIAGSPLSRAIWTQEHARKLLERSEKTQKFANDRLQIPEGYFLDRADRGTTHMISRAKTWKDYEGPLGGVHRFLVGAFRPFRKPPSKGLIESNSTSNHVLFRFLHDIFDHSTSDSDLQTPPEEIVGLSYGALEHPLVSSLGDSSTSARGSNASTALAVTRKSAQTNGEDHPDHLITLVSISDTHGSPDILEGTVVRLILQSSHQPDQPGEVKNTKVVHMHTSKNKGLEVLRARSTSKAPEKLEISQLFVAHPREE